MSIGIVIPCYKESENISKLINKINTNLKEVYLYIIDDSPDNQIEELIKDFDNVNYFKREKKLGRGSAVLFGIKKILEKKNISTVIEMDADLSHDPFELKENLKFFNKNQSDLLISSRYLKNSKIINWSIQRLVFSYLSNKLAKFLLKVPVTDYTNGYRIYSKPAAEHIIKKCGKIGDGFIILSEILVELYYNKFVVLETSSIFRNRVRGESSVNFKEIVNSFIGLIKIYRIKTKLCRK